VVVALRTDATPLDQAKAYFHALLLGQKLEQQRKAKSGGIGDDGDAEKNVATGLEHAWGSFSTTCRAARWDLSVSEVETKGYEIDFQR
jgi:hypothetical protein